MIDLIQTLFALKKYKTMQNAASHMRLTQSTVSKRIDHLEHLTGRVLLTRVGRRVQLTEQAELLLTQMMPHVLALEEIMQDRPNGERRVLSLGISESILSSWGTDILSTLGDRGLDFELHAHRGPTLIDKVESGRYDLALLVGPVTSNGLMVESLGRERFVVAGGKEKNFYTIEESSQTWKAIREQCLELGLSPSYRLETFVSIAQLISKDLACGLIPMGISKTYIGKKKRIQKTKVIREIQLIYRKKIGFLPDFESIVGEIRKATRKSMSSLEKYY